MPYGTCQSADRHMIIYLIFCINFSFFFCSLRSSIGHVYTVYQLFHSWDLWVFLPMTVKYLIFFIFFFWRDVTPNETCLVFWCIPRSCNFLHKYGYFSYISSALASFKTLYTCGNHIFVWLVGFPFFLLTEYLINQSSGLCISFVFMDCKVIVFHGFPFELPQYFIVGLSSITVRTALRKSNKNRPNKRLFI